MVFYLCRMCQCGLIRSNIGILIPHASSTSVYSCLMPDQHRYTHASCVLNIGILMPHAASTSVYSCLIPPQHRYTHASCLLAIEMHVPQDFMPLSVFLWNDLADPIFVGVLLAGFRRRANSFLLALAAHLLSVFNWFSHSLSCCWLVLWGSGLKMIEFSHSLSCCWLVLWGSGLKMIEFSHSLSCCWLVLWGSGLKMIEPCLLLTPHGLALPTFANNNNTISRESRIRRWDGHKI